MKNQIQFLILFIVLGFCSLQAQVNQEWVARYNGPGIGTDYANSLAVDGSGNVYVLGCIHSKYVTIKYNSSGVQQWIQIYNGPGDDYPTLLAVDGLGNVYVTGTSGEFPNCEYATIKYNSSGDSLWVARYNGPGNSEDRANSLAVDISGNVYVTGGSYGGANTGSATIKYNSLGVPQWVARYNGLASYYWGMSLAVDGSGNVYVTGTSYGTASFDFETIKYNSSGDSLWVARYNGPGNGGDFPSSLAVDGSGNVYVTGASDGYFTRLDYATIKYNSLGIQQWVQRYNRPGSIDDYPSSLAVDSSGNVYVTGVSVIVTGYIFDYATIKYNSSGIQQWVQRYDCCTASSIAVDGSGNVYITGGGTDYLTIKFNSSGVQQWVERYNGPGNGYDGRNSLAIDGSGNVYVTGVSIGTGYDFATIKYSQTEVLTAPSKLKAQSVDSSFIKVTWRDNSNDEDGFYIERTNINDSSHWDVIDAVPQNVDQYSDYLVTRGLKYFYRVKAYSGNTYSEYSNIDSVILGGDPSFIPAAPAKLVLLKRTANAISMGWLDNSGNENGFIIARKSDADLFFRIIDSVGTDVVTYQEVGLSPGLNYSYKICSFNASGISDYSNTLIILPKSAPDFTSPELSGNSILSGNYPNPFNPKTIINYQIQSNVKRQTSDVKLIIYNMLGKEIVTLVNEKQNAGSYSVEWDASNFSSGVYFYQLQADEFIETRKMTLIK